MLQGIERKATGALSGIVPQLIGHKAVAQLMERNAHQGRNNAEENTEKIGKIKPIPY